MVQSVCEDSQKIVCHVDDVFDKFSIFGRYHLQVSVLVILAFTSNSAYATNYIFAASSVEYRCKDPYDNATQCAAWSNGTGCTKWEYDDPNSFVAEFGLACQEWKRTLVGTVHSVAYMVGLLIVGPFSDRVGRKTATVITGVLGGVFGLARSFSTGYWFYIAMEFLESAIGDICSPIYVLEMEIVSAKNKIRYNTLCALGYVTGGVMLAGIAWLVPYWRTFLQVIYAPALLFFSYQYLLDESPRWLLMRGKKEKAIKILQKAAKKNNISLDKNVLDNLSSEVNEDAKFLDHVANTFRSRALRLRFFVCLMWWTTSTFVHYGMVINSVSLQGNKYMNYALSSLLELPSNLLTMWIMIYLKRKLPLMISFFLGGLICMVQPFMPKGLSWLSITFYMIGKLISSIYFGITYIYTLELFPTYTRNSMHALCSSLGRIGAIIAPQTPLLLPIWFGLPNMVFGVTAILAGLTTILVPDITNDALPDTVEDAEIIGKSESVKVKKNDFTDLKDLKQDSEYF